MSNDSDFYQQMLKSLEARRSSLLDELKKTDNIIAYVKTTGLFPMEPTAADIPVPTAERQPFADMSVRWAVLKFLYEHPTPQKTADISDALLAGGNEKAVRPTVSAVISDMVRTRNEVMPDEETGGYKLTVTGRSAWGAIAHSPKYINRASAASEQ